MTSLIAEWRRWRLSLIDNKSRKPFTAGGIDVHQILTGRQWRTSIQVITCDHSSVTPPRRSTTGGRHRWHRQSAHLATLGGFDSYNVDERRLTRPRSETEDWRSATRVINLNRNARSIGMPAPNDSTDHSASHGYAPNCGGCASYLHGPPLLVVITSSIVSVGRSRWHRTPTTSSGARSRFIRRRPARVTPPPARPGSRNPIGGAPPRRVASPPTPSQHTWTPNRVTLSSEPGEVFLAGFLGAHWWRRSPSDSQIMRRAALVTRPSERRRLDTSRSSRPWTANWRCARSPSRRSPGRSDRGECLATPPTSRLFEA